ncbi:Hypothetical protein R9X50_00108300 [Acrodontium crateriforme]|uniref:S-adenosyl-L-methionine-dependent methyltransferase n=1 Tax=Acrodontium crateriforme TaxID=150365 RepID=A0AAQ3R2K2_9PEZI|nr:Hypothetical protein R9X50_00108300 [Acrodontium crateriforme]
MYSLFSPVIRPIPIISASAGGLFVASVLFPPARMNSTSSHSWNVRAYEPRHKSWPYNPSDFTRQDSSVDTSFYSSPRFVTHIDDAAIASLREYYETALPRKGRILDFCSSWVSHYPRSLEDAVSLGELKVTGMGMNKAELDANQVLNNGRMLVDLNVNPDVNSALLGANAIGQAEAEKLDASTNVVSIDYLTKPVEVLKSLLAATKCGGSVHLAISNRCFPTKAISRWLRVREDERLMMVGDFLHFAGWEQIEIVELSDGTVNDDLQHDSSSQGTLQSLMGLIGMNRRDPIWVVRAKKGNHLDSEGV